MDNKTEHICVAIEDMFHNHCAHVVVWFSTMVTTQYFGEHAVFHHRQSHLNLSMRKVLQCSLTSSLNYPNNEFSQCFSISCVDAIPNSFYPLQHIMDICHEIMSLPNTWQRHVDFLLDVIIKKVYENFSYIPIK